MERSYHFNKILQVVCEFVVDFCYKIIAGAWIVTGGTNAGVMKHVGEAVRDFGLTSEGRVMAIGIASWGCIQSKEQLISADVGHLFDVLPEVS